MKDLFSKKGAAPALALALTLSLLAGCSGGSKSAYSTYASAYNKVTANAGIDADLSARVTMDGEVKNAEGNFKVDNSTGKTLLYLEVEVEGDTMEQFCDGDYIYLNARGEKVKYALGEKPDRNSGSEQGQEGTAGEAPEFDTDSFLSEFSSFFEAGKIQELGLLSPIPENAVSKAEADGNVIHLTIGSSALKAMEKTLSESVVTSSGTSIEVNNLQNFSYDAVVEGGTMKSVTYQGTLDVKVPASLSSSGSEESYTLDVTIAVEFNNPGSKVSVTIPSTDGYREI